MLGALLLRLLKGDPDVTLEDRLGALVPKADRWIARELGPDQDREDVLQDALTAVAAAVEAFDSRANFETYAYRIVIRVARHHRRRSARFRRALEVAPPPVDHRNPESAAMDRQALRSLYRSLERLSERRRRAFILCCIEGSTPSEAAVLEGTSATNIRSRVRHARLELARLLSHDAYLSELTEAKP